MKKFFVFRKFFAILLSCMLFVSLIGNAAAVSSSEVMPLTVTGSEVEPNNTFATAQTMHSDYTLTGYIGYAGDVDYYKVTFPASGYANFWLGDIPSTMDLDLFIYNSAYTLIASKIDGGSAELISNMEVVAGETYYIKVQAFYGDMYDTADSYLIRAKMYLDEYIYYAQNPLNITATNLEKTYSTSYPTLSWKTALINEGCVISSYAMVLNNMDATISSVEDVRLADENGNMSSMSNVAADPYTVMIANANAYAGNDITYNATEDKFYIDSTRYPVGTNIYDIALRFGVEYDRYNFNSSHTNEYKKNAAAYLVAENPQGICLFFENPSVEDSTHMIVLTETSYTVSSDFALMDPTISSQSISDSTIMALAEETVVAGHMRTYTTLASAAVIEDGEQFIVFDPYSVTHDGGNVCLSDSYTGNTYTWNQLFRIEVLYRP